MTKTEQAIDYFEGLIRVYDIESSFDSELQEDCAEVKQHAETALTALKTQQAVDAGRMVVLPCILDDSRIAYIKSIIDSQIKYAKEALNRKEQNK
ncbi:MAG: hypothetical protein LBS36_13575 [Oscillospiraceae bacterium]|jgi:hypothetical protein|nr:hypothetical protein [Oscillospiraceae bacterium]